MQIDSLSSESELVSMEIEGVNNSIMAVNGLNNVEATIAVKLVEKAKLIINEVNLSVAIPFSKKAYDLIHNLPNRERLSVNEIKAFNRDVVAKTEEDFIEHLKSEKAKSKEYDTVNLNGRTETIAIRLAFNLGAPYSPDAVQKAATLTAEHIVREGISDNEINKVDSIARGYYDELIVATIADELGDDIDDAWGDILGPDNEDDRILYGDATVFKIPSLVIK